nr:hypothetical protein [Tanacetum cinerariifolium]GEZ70204.1 hypothetical protein [Tanacetum cinerariifolium]
QNGIDERKNQTFNEAAKTMLADSLLPIPFWAEAVNTTCYVQNRVLVTKPHNKTPYELLHGRTPSIGFMRHFGCPVTILNTLNPLGKFQGKVDEGFLVGYSVYSKALRVFNSRTRIIQETLHVHFLENKPNVAETGPTWLFNIDSLTRTMNYQPVHAGNQTNSGVGFQDILDSEKAGEKVDQSYMLFPMWSLVGSTNPQNNAEGAAFDGKEHDFDVKKPESTVILSPSSSAQSKEQDDNTMKEAKGKSPIEYVSGYRDLNAEFQDCSENSRLEDIIYSDDEDVGGAEADFNNLESSIPVSPIPTTIIHKDHPVSQIIGDLSSTTQTRRMTRAVKDQGRLLQIFSNDFHTCTFACFLLQEEPKRVHQALKDPSWIEAMQEELIQFKMQKVWVLVNPPYGKRAIGTKWVYRNKKDERGIVIRNKARLVAQGHKQDERIDYEEVFAPIKGDILLVQIYVDDIIFGATNKSLCRSFKNLMKDKFQMSSIGELTFFLGLQVKQNKDGIFISQDKYVTKILRKFRLTEGKSASTPIDTEKPLLKDPDGEDVDVHTYRLISWQCKKQTVVATSSTEAEYIAAASCCAQVLWI